MPTVSSSETEQKQRGRYFWVVQNYGFFRAGKNVSRFFVEKKPKMSL